jgi:hypothetical protein
MNVILVCIDNFQEYILINIRNLIRLKHKNIFVITNAEFFSFFSEFDSNQIVLVRSESIEDSYNYKPGINVDSKFRNGFWGLTSKRFFYIYSFMKQRNISNVFHIENDVLTYYNCDSLEKTINNDKIWVPADSFQRSIASIIFIPNYEIFGLFLNNYNNRANDMQNLSYSQSIMPHLFDNFPICFKSEYHTPEQKFVTRTYDLFNMIFDAAAIGQYLGGIDPRNNPSSSDTVGFINETSVIKYDSYHFVWRKSLDDDTRKPFMKLDDNTYIPIFNLHIHSKNLSHFVS